MAASFAPFSISAGFHFFPFASPFVRLQFSCLCDFILFYFFGLGIGGSHLKPTELRSTKRNLSVQRKSNLAVPTKRRSAISAQYRFAVLSLSHYNQYCCLFNLSDLICYFILFLIRFDSSKVNNSP